MKKICVIHLNQIGDFVFSLPFLKALKDEYPDAEIDCVVRQYLGELFQRVPFVDRVIYREKGLAKKAVLCKKIRKSRYDLLINLSRSEECFALTAFSNAELKAGFARFPFDLCLDVKDGIEGHNSWYNNRKLLKKLQIPFEKDNYVGLINMDGVDKRLTLPEKYVVVSPGASRRRRTAKAWDETMFAELIVNLKSEYGFSPVLVGSADDRQTNKIILNLYKEHQCYNTDDRVDLAGRIGLVELCSVLKKADLFVGIDSGVMHLASCMDVPVVALFGPSDPFYVGPQNRKSIVVRSSAVDCTPCYFKPCKHINCMKTLDWKDVFEKCKDLLSC